VTAAHLFVTTEVPRCESDAAERKCFGVSLCSGHEGSNLVAAELVQQRRFARIVQTCRPTKTTVHRVRMNGQVESQLHAGTSPLRHTGQPSARPVLAGIASVIVA